MKKGGGVPHITGENLSKLKIPVPPLPVQSEIVRILDKYTELTAELKNQLSAELTVRKKQYSYYRDKLLRFDRDCEWQSLGEICTSVSSGKAKTKEDYGIYPVYGSTGIIAKTNKAAYNKKMILIARVGANAGYTHLAEGQYDVSDNTLILDVKSEYNLKYIYYQLIKINLHQYARVGGQPLVTAGQIKQVSIPIPSINEQIRIVAILDRFDALCNDLTSGIPAEIEARRKQYEYYRDKLLSFKECASV